MKFRPTLLAAVLALSVGRSFAREPDAPPSPADPAGAANYSLTRNKEDVTENIFVGHFSETLRVDSDLVVDAKMVGPMEQVNFHFKTVDPTNIMSALYFPEAKDFVPENFARLRLMQMLVIPKDVPGGFKSLDALREAKARELGANGNSFDLRLIGGYPWPPETFSVSISTPYPLFQLYTQSDRNFFIVTVGENPYTASPKDRFMASTARSLCSSLSTYLDQFAPPLIEEVSFLDLGFAALPWFGVCVIAVAFGFLRKTQGWQGRLRLMVRMAFVLATGSLLAGAPLLFASMKKGLGRTLNEASILFIAGLVMPWICRAVSARLNGQRPWRVFFWSMVANILPLIAGIEMARGFRSGADTLSGAADYWSLSVTLCFTALLNGVAFGLTHRDSKS